MYGDALRVVVKGTDTSPTAEYHFECADRSSAAIIVGIASERIRESESGDSGTCCAYMKLRGVHVSWGWGS